MVFGKWVEGYFQKAIYILQRNWIICILDVWSMKCRNIQVQMSSGSWKCCLGSQRRNEGCDHVSWGGGWFTGRRCSVREGFGRVEGRPSGSMLGAHGKREEGEPVKDTEKSPERKNKNQRGPRKEGLRSHQEMSRAAVEDREEMLSQ